MATVGRRYQLPMKQVRWLHQAEYRLCLLPIGCDAKSTLDRRTGQARLCACERRQVQRGQSRRRADTEPARSPAKSSFSATQAIPAISSKDGTQQTTKTMTDTRSRQKTTRTQRLVSRIKHAFQSPNTSQSTRRLAGTAST